MSNSHTLRNLAVAAAVTVSPFVAKAQTNIAANETPKLFAGQSEVLLAAISAKPTTAIAPSFEFRVPALHLTAAPAPVAHAAPPAPAPAAEVESKPKRASTAKKIFSVFARGITPELDKN